MATWDATVDDARAPRPGSDRFEIADRRWPTATERPVSTPCRGRLLALDVVVLAVAWTVALLLPSDRDPIDALVTVGAVSSGVLTAWAYGLYSAAVTSMRVVVLSRLVRTAALAALVAWMAYLWLDRSEMIALNLACGAVWSFFLLALGRSVFDRWLGGQRANGRFCRTILLVGSSSEVEEFCDFLADRPELGYRIAGWVGPVDGRGAANRLGSTTDALVQVERSGASSALFLTAGLSNPRVADAARELLESGVHVHLWSGLAGINYRRMVPMPVGHEPFVRVAPMTASRAKLAGKRIIDVTLALAVLAISAPVVVVAGVLIKMYDRGPILFSQTRVGQHGKPITVHKLRTMDVDAEERLTDLRAENERDGPLFKLTSDPRVTPIGGFLRRTSLDELPQLFDVVRGHLSLVGPRPALPSEVALFDVELLGRLRVRPGITGLWQVEGRDKPSFDVYRHLDLFYVQNWSLALDFAILLDSVPAVIARGLLRPSKSVENVRPLEVVLP